MGAQAIARLPFSAKKIRRAPTVKKLHQQVLVNESGNDVDFTKLLKLMNQKYIPSDIFTLLQQNRVQVSRDWACGPWEDVESKIVDIINHPMILLPRTPHRKGLRQAVSEEIDHRIRCLKYELQTGGSWQTDESGAISDTSFTPPKNLANCVRFDDEGRRHILPPPGFGDAAPKQQSRFVRGDENGQKHLMPPPGFRGALPKLIDEPPVALKFERRKDFKNEFEKRQVTHGGISLAAMREQSQPKGKKNKCSFAVRQSEPKKEQPPSPKKMAGSPPTDRLSGGWESAFVKGVFDAEEDLIYSGRWPASTF
ncbi:hypothetical protein F4801DRAFT_585413 [Xylaria longipes]|nr:hypothetical protein F4801DRAFT_585413 [Xylaria longipes]